MRSFYEPKLKYDAVVDLEKTIDLGAVSRYLMTGKYAKPGSNHFLAGRRYNEIERLSIKRGPPSSLDGLLNTLRQRVSSILEEHRRVGLFLTSGHDSYLLYLLFKEQQPEYDAEINLITGRFKGAYDEAALLKEKNSSIVIHPRCVPISSSAEVLALLYRAIGLAEQPVNGMVAVSVLKAFEIAEELDSVPILGVGETIFFTSDYEFISKVRDSATQSYASDKTIQPLATYLTQRGMSLAKADREQYEYRDPKIFDYRGPMESFIHDQQFMIDAPRVDYEMTALGKNSSFDAITPYRDSKLLEIFLNLPEQDQHDGRAKTPIKKLIARLQPGAEKFEGLSMTSPQREYLRRSHEKGGFSGLMKYFLGNSMLADLDLINLDSVGKEYADYVNEFDRTFGSGEFKALSSYSLWKFFITEFWLHKLVGMNLRDFSIINKAH